ncbi:MAG: four helix bundle protein [Planctomycetes bacterium]|nr:four helix bundle protein [Planctomycetota bacterium]
MTFRDLIVWKKAIAMTKIVYQVSRDLPMEERYGLTSQMRRAAVSVASNIAEGNARQARPDYIHFLMIARGSLAELETQLIIAGELHMLSETETIMEAIQETRRILQGLITSLRKEPRSKEAR